MRVVLLQPPAWQLEHPAGTIAGVLGVPRIVFGDLVRAHIRQGTELGTRCDDVFRSGGPVPDQLVSAIAHDHLRQAAPAAFLLEGHPLNTAQAHALDELLHELGTPLDRVLHLRLSEHEVDRRVRRQAARRLCRETSLHCYEPGEDDPPGNGLCEVCGGGLYQRADDTEERIRDRFRFHDATAESVVQHYAGQDLVVTVDAAGTHEQIAGRAFSALHAPGR
ncbi:adenylate kinase family protein [Kitasatospora sp. NPDC059827]|uniref:adenylate kinase family protein n=1 Tax=Kitasatospora sp. NPDC059827 TaxID=3346964 RepID=UPI00364B8631